MVDRSNTKSETGCEVTRKAKRILTAKRNKITPHCNAPSSGGHNSRSSGRPNHNPKQQTFLAKLKINSLVNNSPAFLGSPKTVTLVDFWVSILPCVLITFVLTFHRHVTLSVSQVSEFGSGCIRFSTAWGFLSKRFPHINFPHTDFMPCQKVVTSHISLS
jgi:hypothetical protein